MPSRSKLLRAQSDLLRRLRRLAKLGLDQNPGDRSQNVGGRPAACVIFYYFGAVSLGKCLQTGRRVVYLTGQPGSAAGEEDG